MNGSDKRLARWVAGFGCLALVVAAGLGWWRASWRPPPSGLEPDARPAPVAARGDFSAFEKANVAIFQEVSPCVVQVTNLTQDGNSLDANVQEVPQGVGSGFVWDREGHIVTNYHVVEGASDAQVTLADHSVYQARNIWAYPDKDIAVIWIDAPREKLHPIAVGTSHDLKVGQIALVLGDPFGLDQTMTMGIVSALDREIQSETGRAIRGVIQTSAAMNPGNSGGPLLDSSGRLIGMNTAIVSPSGAFAGIGFAIPVDEINRVVLELIRKGKVEWPKLGVDLAQDQLAEKLGVSEGALILKVQPDTPAARAGLLGTRRAAGGQIRLGDVIVAVDDQPVKSGADLHALLDQHKRGDTIRLTIVRDEKRENIEVTL